ncbi:MAG: radical SAM protein [Deltaproteobacteria bacterium]|nr:radical SAM protein [Deltaproteobacteria bacterium]
MDPFRIDSHKLMYHVDRLRDWLSDKDIYPIYMEVSPAGACNHRCTYCALDYMGYKPRFLEGALLKKRITELSSVDIKSIMFAGEGEPLLHKDIASIINHTKDSGIDAAVTSNGVLLTERLINECLSSITWIKISINAATAKTYAAIHRTREDDFERVIDNIARAVRFRNKEGLKTTIGMQLILLPENAEEAAPLAMKAKDIGADYLVIKSYSQHLKSITRKYNGIRYSPYYDLSEKLKKIEDERFKVIFRLNAMRKLDEAEKPYGRCLAIPFWAYIDSCGGVWACSAHLGDERFCFGNIHENTIKEIWGGEKRKKALEYAANGLDIKDCRMNCRMDEVNRYLWDLKNPPAHVNFI